MHPGSALLALLLVSFAFQAPQETFRRHHEAAEAYARAGNLAAAESEYSAILLDGYIALGRLRSNRGDFDRAVEPLQHAVEIDASNATAHTLLGTAYLALRDFAKASSELESASKIAPADFEVGFTLAISYLEGRRYDDAKRVFDGLVSALGEQPQLHMVIGRAYREAGLLRDSIAEFQKAVALDPKFPRVHHNLGLAFLLDEGASKLREAEREFKAELQANPDEYFANYYLGIVAIYDRNWTLAVDYLLRASSLRPDNPDPYFQLGQAYQELGKHDLAVAALARSVALNPSLSHNKFQVTTAHYRLAQSLLRVGRTEDGQRELKRAAELKAEAFTAQQQGVGSAAGMNAAPLPEDDGELSAKPARARRTESRTDDASNAAESYLEKVLAAAHNNVGLLRAERRDAPVAAEHFRRAASLNPNHPGVNFNLGLARFQTGAYSEAIAPLENETRANTRNVQARWLLGLCYFRTRDYSRSADALADVPGSGSKNADLYVALGVSRLESGDAAGAIAPLESAASLTPDDGAVRDALARARHAAGGTNP